MAVALQFCRLFVRLDSFVLENHLSGFVSFGRRKAFSFRCSSGDENVPSPSVVMDSDFDAKTFRKNLTRSNNYNRKGFGHKEETLKLMNREYTRSNLQIGEIVDNLSDDLNHDSNLVQYRFKVLMIFEPTSIVCFVNGGIFLLEA